MGVTEKMWDAITAVIKMNDKVERLASTVRIQQEKIENLAARIVRLETALEIAFGGRGPKTVSRRQIDDKD